MLFKFTLIPSHITMTGDSPELTNCPLKVKELKQIALTYGIWYNNMSVVQSVFKEGKLFVMLQY